MYGGYGGRGGKRGRGGRGNRGGMWGRGGRAGKRKAPFDNQGNCGKRQNTSTNIQGYNQGFVDADQSHDQSDASKSWGDASKSWGDAPLVEQPVQTEHGAAESWCEDSVNEQWS